MAHDQSNPTDEAVSLISSPIHSSPSRSPATSPDPIEQSKRPQRPGGVPRRQSSFAQPRPKGEPRTPNRVRFDFQDAVIPSLSGSNGHAAGSRWIEQEDPLHEDDEYFDNSNGHGGARLPLLTGVEAPTVTLSLEETFNPEDHLENARPRSGMKSAFMNMANSIIGAGIIGLPYAFRQAGLVTGLILLLCLAVTVDWTIRLIVINSKLSGTDSFQSTVQHCFGKSGLVAISLAQWVFAFGGMIAFCIIIGDTIPHVLVALFPTLPEMHFLWLFSDRRAIIVLFTLGISYPLSLYRDIAKLAKASTLALISMLFIIITIIVRGPQAPAESKGPLKDSLFINSGFFQAIGVISFAFVCHHNSLLIYGSLRRPTIDRFARVTHYSTGISVVACLVVALSGFLTFGDHTKGNVLNNFPTDDIMVNIARMFFGLNMLTTMPLECFVCREVMTEYYFPREPFHPNRHLIFTTSLVVTTMGLSLITCDLGIVFEFFGATSACALAFILPPLCFLKLSSKGGPERYAAMGCVAFGTAVLCISLALAVAKMIKSESSWFLLGFSAFLGLIIVESVFDIDADFVSLSR